MSDPFQFGELGRLVARLVENEITEEELTRLESMLKDDPEAQQFYLDYVALDSELVWSFDESPRPVDLGSSEAIQTTPNVPVSAPVLASPEPVRRSWFVPAIVGTLLAGCLAFVVFRVLRSPLPDPIVVPTAFARIVELGGSAEVLTPKGKATPASVGQELASGQTIRVGQESSFAVVEYSDRSRLELLADTVARLDRKPVSPEASGKKVFVSRGLVRADDRRQPDDEPMLLATPHAEIHILGSTFISAIAPEGTRVEMERGRVEVTRQADGQTISLDSGRFVEATADLAPMVTRPLPELLRQPWNVLNTSARTLAFSPSGDRLALAWKSRVALWDALTWTKLRKLRSKHEDIRAIGFLDDGLALLTGGKKPHSKLWELPEGRGSDQFLRERRVQLSTFHVVPGGRALVWAEPQANRTSLIQMWEAGLRQVRTLAVSSTRNLHCVALSPDWSHLVAGTRKGKLIFWNPESAEPGEIVDAHRRRVRVLAFSPTGELLATGSDDGVVKVWSLATRQPIQRLEGHGRQIVSLAFSPDGSLLATGRNDGSVKLWNPKTAEERATIAHSRRGEVRCLAFAPDGRTLITAIPGRPIFVWNLGDNREIH